MKADSRTQSWLGLNLLPSYHNLIFQKALTVKHRLLRDFEMLFIRMLKKYLYFIIMY